MVFTIEDEGIRWTSHFLGLRDLGLHGLGLWDELVMSKYIARRRDDDQSAIRIFRDNHRSLNQGTKFEMIRHKSCFK